MVNVILIVVLAAIIGLAAAYVYKEKKKGHKCIGCPSGGCNCKDESGGSCCTTGCCGSSCDGR